MEFLKTLFCLAIHLILVIGGGQNLPNVLMKELIKIIELMENIGMLKEKEVDHVRDAEVDQNRQIEVVVVKKDHLEMYTLRVKHVFFFTILVNKDLFY